MSKLSNIVPVYNGERSLSRCIDSILAQDHRDLEIILVDDGSRDNSYKIMKEYAEKDERIIPVHKENGGVSSTRNKGLSLASGDYIQFIDVDDWLPFDSVKMMVRAIEESDADMVIGDFYRVIGDKISRKGSISKGGMITRNEYADKMLLRPADFYYGVLWNKLYRRSIIENSKIRMDEGISYCEDMIFNLEYLLHAKTVYVLKAPVYYYVRTEGSLVEQNLSIENTVKMKTSVIRYYADFYKNINDEEDYEERKPIIYGYLLAVSTDAFAIPFLGGARKLGEERGEKLFFDESLEGSELLFDYVKRNLFLQILSPIAQQNRIDLNDMKVLYFLYKKKKPAAIEEIASFCNLTLTVCTLTLTKLLPLPYVKIADIKLFDDDKVLYEYVPGKLDDELVKAEKDYLALCFSDIDEADIDRYREIRNKIYDNIRRTLVGMKQ